MGKPERGQEQVYQRVAIVWLGAAAYRNGLGKGDGGDQKKICGSRKITLSLPIVALARKFCLPWSCDFMRLAGPASVRESATRLS